MYTPLEICEQIQNDIREYNRILEEYEKKYTQLIEAEMNLQYKKSFLYLRIKEMYNEKKISESFIENYIQAQLKEEYKDWALKDAEVKILKEKMKFLALQITALQTLLNFLKEELKNEGYFEKI